MKKHMPWVAAVVLATAAWGVTLLAPPPSAWRAPFVTELDMGETKSSGNLAVVVHEVSFSDEVTESQSAGIWTGSGNFLVLDISAQTVTDERVSRIVTRTATVDGNEYWPTDRVTSQLTSSSLSVAMSLRGTIVYELPADVTNGTITVLLGSGQAKQAGQTTRIEIDLGALERHESLRLEPPAWESSL